MARLLLACALAIGLAIAPAPFLAAQSDPFAALDAASGAPSSVPPRAIAVMPERNLGRLLRVVDHLVAVDPQLDPVAVTLGVHSDRAIQLRLRDAGVPVLLRKTEATIATTLALRAGAEIEITGVLVFDGGRYALLASDVRASGTATARR